MLLALRRLMKFNKLLMKICLNFLRSTQKKLDRSQPGSPWIQMMLLTQTPSEQQKSKNSTVYTMQTPCRLTPKLQFLHYQQTAKIVLRKFQLTQINWLMTQVAKEPFANGLTNKQRVLAMAQQKNSQRLWKCSCRNQQILFKKQGPSQKSSSISLIHNSKMSKPSCKVNSRLSVLPITQYPIQVFPMQWSQMYANKMQRLQLWFSIHSLETSEMRFPSKISIRACLIKSVMLESPKFNSSLLRWQASLIMSALQKTQHY